MIKILDKLTRSTKQTSWVGENGLLMVSSKTQRRMRRDFATRLPQEALKAIEPAFAKISLLKPEPHIKTHLLPLYFIYNRFQNPTQPFDYPLILIKILPETKMFIGVGQELIVLHKSFHLILTLSQLFSLPRVIENSPMGIVDSRERSLLPKEVTWST